MSLCNSFNTFTLKEIILIEISNIEISLLRSDDSNKGCEGDYTEIHSRGIYDYSKYMYSVLTLH